MIFIFLENFRTRRNILDGNIFQSLVINNENLKLKLLYQFEQLVKKNKKKICYSFIESLKIKTIKLNSNVITHPF